MVQVRHLILALSILTLNACGLARLGDFPVSNLYCDNFLIYDMCAEDLNRDGVVEYVFFEDSLDVFMYREGAEASIPDKYGLHRCALLMDEDLVATTSRVFMVTDETTYLERQDIKGAMMIKYIAYMPRVTACNLRAEQAAADGAS